MASSLYDVEDWVAESYFEMLQNIKYDGKNDNDNKGGDNTQNNDDDNEFI